MKTNQTFNVWNPKFKSMGTAIIKKNKRNANYFNEKGRQRDPRYKVVGLEKGMHLVHFAHQQAEYEFLNRYQAELTPDASWRAGYTTKLEALRHKADMLCLSLASFSSDTINLNKDVVESINSIAKKTTDYLKDEKELDTEIIEKEPLLLSIKIAKAQSISDLFDRYYTKIEGGMLAHFENYKQLMKLRKEAHLGTYTPSSELQRVISIIGGTQPLKG